MASRSGKYDNLQSDDIYLSQGFAMLFKPLQLFNIPVCIANHRAGPLYGNIGFLYDLLHQYDEALRLLRYLVCWVSQTHTFLSGYFIR